jgi:predicted  nucleic acid-binding Zn ribbon protein
METIINNLEKCLADLQLLSNGNQSNDLDKLYRKLEEKCEQVELLTMEVEKWKSHSQKLDETRLVGIKSLENANVQISKLKTQVSNLESRLKSRSDKYKKIKKYLKSNIKK